MSNDCAHNIDPLKLVREGTSQDRRQSSALDPAFAPLSGRSVSHDIVFAQGYAKLLKFYQEGNPPGDWSGFFSSDLSAPLAVAAVEDVEAYKSNIRSWFSYLDNMDNKGRQAALRNHLGYLYSSIGTLTQALDGLKDGLPVEIPLRSTLQNLIRMQLAPALSRLVAYYKAGLNENLVNAVAAPDVTILRRPAVKFAEVLASGLSADWGDIDPPADVSVYGDASGSVFVRINHCATHNLFRSVFDEFLKVLARVTADASQALKHSLTDWDQHEPHYALYLAFLQLLEHARTAANTLTQRHLDFYYRTILGLKEKPAEPSHVHLLAELARHVPSREFLSGESFRAGKDSAGKDAFFASLGNLVANQAKVEEQRTVYLHRGEPVGSSIAAERRIFASPVANSDDGLGAPLTSADQSWHPFFNKSYADGALAQIRMPKADIGFAVASHYLLMAEGTRTLDLSFVVDSYTGGAGLDLTGDIRCFLTTEKGWLEKPASRFVAVAADRLELTLTLTGADPAVVPFSAAIHGAPKLPGYTFAANLPMLLVRLRQDDERAFVYGTLRDVMVGDVQLKVVVAGLKSLAISNDFGPADPSKPFQPFSAQPVAGNGFIVGSKEIFQKSLKTASIHIDWLMPPKVFSRRAYEKGLNPKLAAVHVNPVAITDDFLSDGLPPVLATYLSEALWIAPSTAVMVEENVKSVTFTLGEDLGKPVLDAPDFSPNEHYSTQSRHGFVRIALEEGFGMAEYQAALIAYLKNPKEEKSPGNPPVGPIVGAISMNYTASTSLALNSTKGVFEERIGRFFHLAPFGTAEQHPQLSGGVVPHLLPQFSFDRSNTVLPSQAEFFIGISGLVPPQNLSLLFQVADGTANPLAPKPAPHIDWSYLRNNQWVGLSDADVSDGTDELLDSGIVALAVPRDATSDNTLMPSGLHWIRAAVHERADAVCMLHLVAAQALEAVFADRANAPDFAATPLPPGTVTKLEKPDTRVKGVRQPYPSFGGRGGELPQAFYTRISERLRHKDRSIALWDYEHLILQAFPQVFKARCLNHTQYEPNEAGTGIYRELAPGHVTIVTVPNLQAQQQRDPLKPYTSLGVLQEIEAFLNKRTSCFVRLHVRNPEFEEVRVRFGLRLHDGYDETYYREQLRQAITRFLSPWAFAGGGAPTFGGKVYKSVLIDFVEEQPYVDYVSDFQLFHDIGGNDGTVDLNEVEGSRVISILVSTPASNHDISIISADRDGQLLEDCGCEA
ncbi:hypothetical protein [Rhizobium leguminosarum]